MTSKEKFDKYYSESSPSKGRADVWFQNFPSRHINSNDADRSGSHVEANTKIINKI